MEAIVTQELSKVYSGLGKKKARSLDALNLTVGENEVFGFLGRNGAGKTTTIKLLCSLLHPTSGTAQIFGESIRSRASRRFIGYLPEQPYFYEYLTPRETLDFYGRLQGLSAGDRAREWDKLAALLDLKDIADERIKGFSKGMRQRVGFAVALVGDPPLLILDEPMSGLDPVGRRTIRELILRCRDEKKTLFFSSHVLSDVERICDRVGILVKGRLIQQGRIDTVTGGHVSRVEVAVTGLPRETAAALAAKAELHREYEGLTTFTMPDAESANAALATIQQAGGTLVEFTPLRVRLEDYFMQYHDRENVS